MSDLEEIRRARRKALIYASIYGRELYIKLYRYLVEAEKKFRGGGSG